MFDDFDFGFDTMDDFDTFDNFDTMDDINSLDHFQDEQTQLMDQQFADQEEQNKLFREVLNDSTHTKRTKKHQRKKQQGLFSKMFHFFK